MAEIEKTEPTTTSPQDAARELGVKLTKRLMPDFYSCVPNRFIPLEEAQAKSWSMFWTGAACRFGHQAARYVANSRQCVDCLRVKRGEPTIYPTSRAQSFHSAERVTKQVAARVAEPAAATQQQPAAPREPSKKEQDFLAALAMTADFDAAAESVGMSRGQIEARASVDPTFKAALTDICERHGIPWTRAADPKAFVWTARIEKDLVARFIDTGLIEQARTDLGVSASVYQQHLIDSPEFAGMIDAARPPARETLKERALHAADRGNDRLLKSLESDLEEDFVRMSDGSKVRRLGNPDAMREEMTNLLNEVRKSLAAKERLREVCVARTAALPQPNRDYDLVAEVAL